MPSISLTRLCMEDEDVALNEEVRCNHGYVLPMMTSWTQRNPGRRYWVCPYYGGPRSCDFWRWRDGEVDPRSKFVIGKLLEKMAQLESRLEVYENIEKPRQAKQVENKVEVQLEKLECEVDKLKEREKKWKTKLVKAKFKENVLWCIIFVGCILAISHRFNESYVSQDVMKLP